jgi:glucose/arabinose dehydrogenase
MRVSLPAVLLVLVVTGQGCLPYGCSRTESRVLSPADSLSRAYAESVRVDTLVPSGALRSAFDHPRTVAFGPDGTLFVTDTGTHRLVIARPDGDERTMPLDTLRFPYLAGVVGTVPLVYSPEAHMVVAIQEAGASLWIRLPDEEPNGGDLS